MKKLIALLLALIAALSVLSGCSGGEKAKKGISVVTTIFPIYDWVRNIAGGDSCEVEFLLDNGSDLHSFQPSAEDILTISSCDVFIYVGGESDLWVNDALKEAKNKDIKSLSLLEALGDKAKEEETVEGMEKEAEEENEPEADEHVWLSLKNAELFTEKIEKLLSQADPQNESLYKKNAEKYISKLEKLDNDYEKTVKSAERDALVFGDRFPFRYLTDDYALKYYAAFSGCSAETEASFETIIFLAKKVDELKLPAVIKIETSDGKIARTVKENTKSKSQDILTLDSLQNASAADIDAGKTYLGAMSDNLKVLKKAIGVK